MQADLYYSSQKFNASIQKANILPPITD